MPLVALGIVATAVFVAHATAHLARGRRADVLWGCNVAALLIGLGCLTATPVLVAVGVLWLVGGTPLWVLDLAAGGEVMATSFLTHGGGLAVGVVAVRQLGWPRGSWCVATLALLLLALVTRLATPPGPNVNLVFAVWKGWERRFPRHGVYFAGIVAVATLVFLGVEAVALRLVRAG